MFGLIAQALRRYRKAVSADLLVAFSFRSHGKPLCRNDDAAFWLVRGAL